MATKKTPSVGPTIGQIKELFRDLYKTVYQRGREESDKLYEKVKERREELERDPLLKTLEERWKEYAAKHKKEQERMRQKIHKVQRLFQSHGPTPKVLKQVQDLIEEFNNA